MRTVQAPTSSEPLRPAGGELIPLSEPMFGGNEWRYLKECLDSGWVSSVGPFVDRFEQAVAALTGVPHAVAVVNGTAGLHIALQLVGVEPGNEVLVSDLTFVAPVNAVHYCGAHPILVDADAATWQLDVDKLERFLSTACELRGAACYNRKTGRHIRAILPVHILGLACAMDRLMGLAQRFHLRVVEDAAEALGVRYQGRHMGTFGDVGVLSFNGNKIVTSGGGGMVITSDRALAERARYLTTQAKDDDTEYIHDDVGYNYRLTNLQAAVGLAQLEQLPTFLERKRSIARSYTQALKDVEGVTAMPTPAHTEPTYWLYTMLLPESTTIAQRQQLMRRLREQGVCTRPFWHPMHGLRPYRDCQTVSIEQADRLYARGLSLPSGAGLSDAAIARCLKVLAETLSAR